MTFPRISRRWFLLRTVGFVLLSAMAAGFVQVQPVSAIGPCYEPIADQTGWSTDGDESFTSGSATTPLVVIDDVGASPDPDAKPYITIYCADPAFFSSERSVSPVLSIDPGANSASQGNIGVHVTLNDGLHQIRVLVRDEGGGLRMSFEFAPNNLSNGIPVSGRALSFTLTNRVSTGEAVLAANGQTEVAPVEDFQVPTTGRSMTIEFGTYNVPATSTSRWTNLGLPPRPATLPATLDLQPSTINLKAKGQYITAYIESSAFDVADIDVSTVTLQAINPVTSVQLPVATGSPTAVGDGNRNGVTDRMVKFDRATVQSWFTGNADADFRVRGRLMDGTSFQGDGTGRIINAGVTHTDQADPASIQY